MTAVLSFVSVIFAQGEAFAACGANTRTWGGASSTAWNTTTPANWVGGVIPSGANENAVIVAATRNPSKTVTDSLACVDVQSGVLTASTNLVNLTVTGDYFRALNSGSVSVTAGRTFYIIMGGTTAQTLEVVDPLNYVTVTNNSTVTFTQPFTIRNTLTLSGTGTTLNINGNLTVTNALTIPAGVTVNVASDVTLTSSGNLTINGTLVLNPGAKLLMGNGRTLSVGATGLIKLNGASGHVATVDCVGTSYTFSVAGAIWADYFQIARTGTAGVNVTGTIQNMSNGEFHYIANTGVGLTFGAAAVVPTTLNYIGFFNDAAVATPYNIDATSYNVSSVLVDNYYGAVSGAAFEKADPNARISWGTQLGTMLALTDATASGSPPATIAASSAATLFSTFSFALTQASAYTDITSAKLAMYGTGSSSDINYIQIFKDAGGGTNCVYNAGVDTQVGANLTMSGSPPTATVTFAAGDVRTSGSTPACFHVLVATSATAQVNNTIGISVEATADITNVKGDATSYTFAPASAPPVRTGTATITGAQSIWNGSSTTAWATAANWTPATLPSSTRDCQVGSGLNIPAMGASRACRNAELPAGGTLNFGGAANQLQVYGALDVATGYTFQNATAGSLVMMGTTSQSAKIRTVFPGGFTVANTGSAVVSIDADSYVTGNVAVNQGTLRISSGYTLSVGGNLTVATGATLEVMAGATLAMADGRSITINNGGTLKIVGTVSSIAQITSYAGTTGYSITVNGTIQANYYKVDRLGTGGMVIGAGATIDATSYLQNGSFTYPLANNISFLTLNLQIPGNTLSGMAFDAAGSSATGITNITTSAAAGTLSITSYSGSWAGPAYENAPTYVLAWSGATNTIDVTTNASSPASTGQGVTVNMGRFGFKQTQAGASYSNTDITSLKLTLTGTGSASDVTGVRAYYDSGCTGTGGTLAGSGTFSGNPATVTFSSITGATVQASLTTPPTRCFYVEYDISASAGSGNTVGVSLAAGTDFSNSQSYALSATTPAPITLGTPTTIIGTTTTWTGTTSTAWCTSTNWNAGVPTASMSCVINNVTNKPVISGTCTGVTPVCKNVTINSGSLTMNAGTELQVYGSFTNSATFTQNTGTLRLMDDGINATNQTIASTPSNAFTNVTFTKTAGGTASVSGTSGSITGLTFPGGSNFTWKVPNAQTLTLTNGLSLPAGTFEVASGGTLTVGPSTTISVTGGTFLTTGTNDVYPQTLTNKATVKPSSGTFAFTATSGTVSLTGFLFNYLDNNGLNIGGTTTLSALNGGQFSYLSASYAAMKAIQLNTTGSIPAIASNVGWNWGAPNSTYTAPPSPLETDPYTLAYSSGCSGQTIAFDQWFGDFFNGVDHPVTSTKVSATSCTITIAASASPVSVLSFTGTAYDLAAVLNWTTTAEVNHAGFNVYRSMNPSSGYVQINSGLVRNTLTSTSGAGVYSFVDNDVANDITYYYRIEDVAINGAKTMHGPVSVTPVAANGVAPTPAPTVNSGGTVIGGSSGNGYTPGTIATPGVVDLGNGVHILAQTQTGLRIEIVPPAPTFAAASWNGLYKVVSVAGYAHTTTAGSPELVTRDILIEVDPGSTGASLDSNTESESAPAAQTITPAPSYALNGSGQLVPSHSVNGAVYGVNAYAPSSYVNMSTSLETINSRKYLRINVQPIKYNPAAALYKRLTRATLDISLSGAGWVAPTPVPSLADSPSAVNGTLRIKFNQTGMYELRYSDLASAGLDGPFAGVSVNNLRLYYKGRELSLQTNSASGFFSGSDYLRFYLFYQSSLEDDYDEAVLSTTSLASSTGAAIRMVSVSGDPTSLSASTELGSLRTRNFEVDNYYVNDLPLGNGADPFYWARVYDQQGQPPNLGTARFTFNIALPNLIQSPTLTAAFAFKVRGRASMAINSTHHVNIYTNNNTAAAGELIFTGDRPQIVTVQIPTMQLVPGTNRIEFRVSPDFVPAGDWDVVDLNALEVRYRSDRIAESNSLEIYNYQAGAAVTATGFTTAAVSVFDTTDPEAVQVLTSPSVVNAGGVFDVTFAADGYRYNIVADGAYLTPAALLLGHGYPLSLRSTSNGADLIVVGPTELLAAAQPLIDQRRAEGMRVITASLTQVFAEFGDGRQSAQAVRDLVTFARANWATPAPQYLLILGDATYDPRNHLAIGTKPNAAPLMFRSGYYSDFGSDNWFVSTSDSNSTPLMAVGRIPAQTAAQVDGYVGKLLAYEAGSRSPSSANITKMIYVTDSDTMNEGFAAQATQLASAVSTQRSAFAASYIDRTAAGGDAATQTAIMAAFNASPLVMTYLGHGAEDRWAAGTVFTNTEAAALTNARLPIIVGLNCLNASFYDADPTVWGLAQTLVLNSVGGAVGFWGSTAMTMPTAQVALAQNFLSSLARETASPYHVVRMGDLALQAKVALGSAAAYSDTIQSYTWIGDPSAKVPSSAFALSPAAAAAASSGGGGSGTTSDGKKGGLMGCGTLAAINSDNDHDGNGSLPNTRGAIELALLAIALVIARKLLFNRQLIGNS